MDKKTFAFIVSLFLVVVFVCWGVGLFKQRQSQDVLAVQAQRAFSKQNVRIDKNQAERISERLLAGYRVASYKNINLDNLGIRMMAELPEVREVKTYLKVAYFDPKQEQYFLLLEEPQPELKQRFTTRLVWSVNYLFAAEEAYTNIEIDASNGRVSNISQGAGISPMELYTLSPDPSQTLFEYKQEADVDGDGHKEVIAMALGPHSTDEDLRNVYLLIYSPVPRAQSWIWSYQYLTEISQDAVYSLVDRANIQLVDDITGDKENEVLATFVEEGSLERMTVVLNDLHYLWQPSLYFNQHIKGEAKVENKKLVITEAEYKSTDPNCCPSLTKTSTHIYNGQQMVLEE